MPYAPPNAGKLAPAPLGLRFILQISYQLRPSERADRLRASLKPNYRALDGREGLQSAPRSQGQDTRLCASFPPLRVIERQHLKRIPLLRALWLAVLGFWRLAGLPLAVRPDS